MTMTTNCTWTNITKTTMIFKKLLVIALLAFLCVPLLSFAQSEQDAFREAEVVQIVETTYPIVFGSEIEFQQLEVKFLDGSLSREIYNDYTPVQPGDTVFVTPGYNPDTETEGFFVREIDRINGIWILGLFFVVVYVVITGVRGIRSLLALALSVGAVWFVLFPLIIAGYNPLLVGVLVSAVILGVALFVTHGFTIVSLASYIGSLISILFTIGFATAAVHLTRISGLVGDESSTISVLYGSAIDIQGLLLAAMIIGILGVLDDVAIMQAAMVREFVYQKSMSTKEIFKTTMKVGQEHAASLVNTLVFAYVAVALPLFLIVLAPSVGQFQNEIPLTAQLSNELFVIEFVRSIVGSFGLVITIPIVTILALLLFKKFPPTSAGHGHHHVH